MARRGVYPGSFNPPTVAHLAIAEAARAQHRLDAVVFTLSRVALAKEHVEGPAVHERAEWVRRATIDRAWAEIAVVDAALIVDIAEGYDVVIMGADKWEQVNDLTFYDGSVEARDAAVGRLPRLAIAARSGFAAPDQVALDLPRWIGQVSSSAVREGHEQWRA
jgi:hypothetical protein